MKLSGISWRILQNTNRAIWIDLFAGQESTRVSSKLINPGPFPTSAVWIFQAIMETTDASYQHQVQLYNVTTSSPVSTPLGSNSLTPDFQGDELVSPADLPAGDNVYELQHKMDTGSSPDEVTLSGAHLFVIYSHTG